MKHKDFSEEQLSRLRRNKNVSIVSRCTFAISTKFYLELYDFWMKTPDWRRLDELLEKAGFQEDLLENEYAATLVWSFQRKRELKRERHELKKYVRDVALVVSGLFERKKKKVEWVPAEKSKIRENYPKMTVEASLLSMGLKPELLGYEQMTSLRKYCGDSIAEQRISLQNDENCACVERPEKAAAGAMQYKDHPYVMAVTGRKSLVMKDRFFNEVCMMKNATVYELLAVYGIDASMLTSRSLGEISAGIKGWERIREMPPIETEQIMEIQIRRMLKLDQYVSEEFEKMRAAVRRMDTLQKKILCEQLSKYPTSMDYQYGYSLREILRRTGISKTTYYKALNCSGYGMAEKLRREKDERDLALLMKVVEYKGFEKGIRQIYMMMPDITGEQFAISKIRRLLRGAGIKTKVRGENLSRQRARKFHERNTKPNLLKREFRLHRPNEVRLTDVTYLDYGHTDDGEKQRAYGSSCIDPVTGKLLAFNISENNDVELAMETLARLSEHPTMIGALFHSDQGILYLTDEFQEKVAEMGMVQSMSKRGNCWDNAPQESFFGHFKDECRYEDCSTFEELSAMIDEYAYYYNHERHQWSRGRMTPIEYEKYMEAMTDEEFAAYMEAERAKYANMKKTAEKKAIERAKTLGV